MKYFSVALVHFVLLILLDLIWIGIIAANVYREQLGTLLSDTVVWPAALLFYALYASAIVVFVTIPALRAGSWKKALGIGAFFGLTAYMTYDLSNLATTRDWPFTITVIDMVWGTILTAVVSVAGFFTARKFVK